MERICFEIANVISTTPNANLLGGLLLMDIINVGTKAKAMKERVVVQGNKE